MTPFPISLQTSATGVKIKQYWRRPPSDHLSLSTEAGESAEGTAPALLYLLHPCSRMPDSAQPISRISDGLVPGIVVAPRF